MEPETEYSLSQCVFQAICQSFGDPQIDLLATRVNAKCEFFVSWFRYPGSKAVDAFTLNWGMVFSNAFPPFAIILPTLRKIIDDSARGILVVPLWPAQPWFPLFSSLLISDLFYFEPNPNLLCSLNRQTHSLWEKITLVVGVLSGNTLLLHKIEKIKMARSIREISSEIEENHGNFDLFRLDSSVRIKTRKCAEVA